MNAATSTSIERISRARNSRRWSVSAIRPSGPTAYFGFPRRSPKTHPTDDKAEGSGVRRRRRVLDVVVVVHEALGLGLEDPQRPATATRELGQLGSTEEQHEHGQDESDLAGAEARDLGQHHKVPHVDVVRRRVYAGLVRP